MSRIMGEYDCFFCLHQRCMKLKLDKKSRPYLKCSRCNTIAFLSTDESLRGPNRLWKMAFTIDGIMRFGQVSDSPVPVLRNSPPEVRP